LSAFCYVRLANRPDLPKENQAALVRAKAQKHGFEIINTGNSSLDVKILALLSQQSMQLNEAVITFRG